ncbi:MAG: thioredoxin [Clostridiales bacterium]|nr:thioredoxin [Clostridiales bacterium]
MDSVNELDFDDIINDDELTVIDFSATWCMPCRMLKPILERVAEKMSDVNFFNLDIDENEDIAKRYRIFSVPTLMAFRKGKMIDSLVGLNSYEDVLAFVRRCEATEIED